MKRLLVSLLALFIMTGLACPPVHAQSEERKSGDWLYTVNEDGSATVTGYAGSKSKLTLPAKLGKRQVTAIGDMAFSGLYDLTSIKLPKGLKRIGDIAFYECDSLTQLTLPDSVSSLGDNPFSACPAEIIVSKKHPVLAVIDGVLFDKTQSKLIAFPYKGEQTTYRVPQGTQSIGDMAFFQCTGLVSLTLPEGLTYIGEEAFSRCTGLTSLDLPKGPLSIGSWAFNECFRLASLTLPEGLTVIGDVAFSQCSRLASLTLPLSLASLGENPFERCPAQITLPAGHPVFETIDGVLFDKVRKTLVAYPYTSVSAAYSVPEGVLTIGASAFRECISLREISLPEGLDGIGEWAFYGTGLVSPAMPESLIYIGASAFSSCFELTSMTLPDGLETIGERAFSACYSLTSLTIPESVSYIGEDAFSGCDALELEVFQGSYAQEWAIMQGVPYQLMPDLAL